MGFDLNTFGSRRTEITDAAGNIAAVIHREIPLGWRAEYDAISMRLIRGLPPMPVKPADDADEGALDAYTADAEAYTEAMRALDRETAAAQTDLFRRMLADVVIGFDGITINGAPPASPAVVLDALQSSGGEYDKGRPLRQLGEAVMGTARVEQAAEKD